MYVPKWVQEFARMYFTKTIAQFVLHGNIVDLVRAQNAGTGTDGATVSYLKFKDYLGAELFKKRELVISYDRAAGVDFRDANMKKDFLQFVDAFDTLRGTTYKKSGVPKEPTEAFALLENYIRLRLNDGKKIALIIDYAETLVPAGENNYFSTQDRAILVYLQRWAQESLFLNSDMTTVLLTENINDLNRQLVRSPFSCEIDIPFPDEEERLLFIQRYIEVYPHTREKMEPTPEVLAKNTAGINLVQLKTLLAEISEGKSVYTFVELTNRKKAIIESEAGGLLEFVETKYTLKDVAGHKYAKEHLLSAAHAIKTGRQDVMPMGYLVNGPVGTGKTFLVSCFAADIGIPMVLLKNFRSQWQGVTEANLEKVLKLLKAMNPVAVMIDEADAYLGNRNAQGDSGVSSRVFSMIASFMSDTENRGKVIWFLLTARPDFMPVDLKRQGRAEEHIALFYPETTAEKRELFEVMLKKTKIKNLSPEMFDDAFYDEMTVLSGADMEAALTRSKFKAAANNETEVSSDRVRETFLDFIPPTYPEEIELMNYVAVLECTSKTLLPEKFKNMSRQEVVERVAELKRKISMRGGA